MASGFDRHQHRAASYALVAGVSASFVLLLAGLAIQPRGAEAIAGLNYRDLAHFWADIRRGAPQALLHAGIVTLIATPVARVAALAVEYTRRRERLFALLAFGILLLLGVSLATGFR